MPNADADGLRAQLKERDAELSRRPAPPPAGAEGQHGTALSRGDSGKVAAV
eukprot:gene49353-38731_t